jgi:hypothetical protein
LPDPKANPPYIRINRIADDNRTGTPRSGRRADPDRHIVGYTRLPVGKGVMTKPIPETQETSAVADLTREMEEAAAALDFEQARILRDRLNLLRGGASVGDAIAADTSGIQRQQPGKMGLGTSQQRMTPPKGWRPPEKPDPMTRGTGRRQPRKPRP